MVLNINVRMSEKCNIKQTEDGLLRCRAARLYVVDILDGLYV